MYNLFGVFLAEADFLYDETELAILADFLRLDFVLLADYRLADNYVVLKLPC